ncbi:glycosyltransferase [Acetobacteraceae bacterium ESL0709]|nr:glycosyltransferase [Acetobacteraceae bacterium ESL0697]MDF7678436.1 glycosyltransferase [Acetobacteraceae bacterium ESL0709]
MSDELAVVLCVDVAYARYAFVTIQSVLDNLDVGTYVKFYIFHEKINESCIFMGQTLFNTKFSSIEFVDLSPLIGGRRFNELHHWNRTVYYSGLIPEILRGRHRYALYLDADVLVCHDVTELPGLMDISKGVGAVAGYPLVSYQIDNDPVYSGMNRQDYEREIIGLQGNQKRFNSGVMLFNLDVIDKDFTRKYLSAAERHFAYTDEDVANFLLKGRVCYLDLAWNVMLDYDRSIFAIDANDPHLKYCLQHPKILHYLNNPKPWDGLKGSFADLYRQKLAYIDLLISEI